MQWTRQADRMLLGAASQSPTQASRDPIVTRFLQSNHSLPGFLLFTRRALAVTMLCGVLLTWERSPLVADQGPGREALQ